jgi:hypothetical protein
VYDIPKRVADGSGRWVSDILCLTSYGNPLFGKMGNFLATIAEGDLMPSFLKRPGNASLIGCIAGCLLVAALNLAVNSLPNWGGDDLWLLAPHLAMIVIAGIAWNSRFWSFWVLACGIVIAVFNPAIWLLIGVHFGAQIDASSGWWLFVGPIIAWNIMAGFVIVAGIVRLVFRAPDRRAGSPK